MLITVQYTTQLKAEIGLAEEHIEVPEKATVNDVLSVIGEQHSDAFRRLVVDSDGNLLPSILLCVNDEQIDAADETILSDSSVITLLSAISGG